MQTGTYARFECEHSRIRHRKSQSFQQLANLSRLPLQRRAHWSACPKCNNQRSERKQHKSGRSIEGASPLPSTPRLFELPQDPVPHETRRFEHLRETAPLAHRMLQDHQTTVMRRLSIWKAKTETVAKQEIIDGTRKCGCPQERRPLTWTTYLCGPLHLQHEGQTLQVGGKNKTK